MSVTHNTQYKPMTKRRGYPVVFSFCRDPLSWSLLQLRKFFIPVKFRYLRMTVKSPTRSPKETNQILLIHIRARLFVILTFFLCE